MDKLTLVSIEVVIVKRIHSGGFQIEDCSTIREDVFLELGYTGNPMQPILLIRQMDFQGVKSNIEIFGKDRILETISAMKLLIGDTPLHQLAEVVDEE